MKIKKRGKKITIKFDNKRESTNLLGSLGFKNIAESQTRDAVEHCVDLSSDKQTCPLCFEGWVLGNDGIMHKCINCNDGQV